MCWTNLIIIYEELPMSQYPQDLFDEDVAAIAALDQARLEKQRVQAEKGTLPAPEDNPVYTIEERKIVTPAGVRQSLEVLARAQAATALSLDAGDTAGAQANVDLVKDQFGIASE